MNEWMKEWMTSVVDTDVSGFIFSLVSNGSSLRVERYHTSRTTQWRARLGWDPSPRRFPADQDRSSRSELNLTAKILKWVVVLFTIYKSVPDLKVTATRWIVLTLYIISYLMENVTVNLASTWRDCSGEMVYRLDSNFGAFKVSFAIAVTGETPRRDDG
jgi:hypothetical protein